LRGSQVPTEMTEQQQAEAAFLAAASDEAPAATPAPVAQSEETTPEVTPPEPPAEPVTPEPPPEPVIAGFKESEVRAMLARVKELDDLRAENRKNFGQIGELKRTLEERLKQTATPPTPASPGWKLNKDKLAQVKEIFPEVAELFEVEESTPAPAAAAEPPPAPPPAVDAAEIERRLQANADALKADTDRRLAIQLLDFRHPDRLQVIATADYQGWLASLKPEQREEIQSTWDVNVVAQGLDTFKAWAAAKQQAAEAEAKAKQDKQKRLEGAVVPTGSTQAPPAALTADQAFLQAFGGG